MTDHPPPTWLTEPCPPWCTRIHAEDDHPDDRFHQSEAIHLDVDGSLDQHLLPVERTMAHLTLIARVGRGTADESTWVELAAAGPPRWSLTLTPTGARRVAAALMASGSAGDEPRGCGANVT